MRLYSISLTLPAGLDDEKAGSFVSALSDDEADPVIIASTAARQDRNHQADWQLQWLCDTPPDAAIFADALNAVRADIAPDLPVIAAADFTIEDVPDINWLAHSYQQFSPFSEGRFFIYGSHYTDTPPPDAIPLQIDAATAFGSGEHGTTAGCLQIMQRLYDNGLAPGHILDLGTGSGILAVAAWKLWQVPVLATDIDPEAVRVAIRHRDLNKVPAQAMTCIESDGFAAKQVQQNAPYGLVIANILASPLKAMAADICAVTGQAIILSGMLHDQVDEVLACYQSEGAHLQDVVRRGDWSSLLLTRG